MKSKSIALIGFMGSGKSVASKKLEELMSMERVSTDDKIEEQQGHKIIDIFFEKGEDYFRRLEHDFIKSIAETEGLIIDCGGGVVLDPENIKVLKQYCHLIYLKASVQQIFERVKDDHHRPLMNVPDPVGQIKELLALREEMYEQAEFIIDTDGKSNDEVCQEIVRVLKNE